MQVVFRPEAEQELLDAKTWYEEKARGLGFEFARAADAAVELAFRNPLGHVCIDAEFRRILLRKFPYMLIYLPSPTELLVVSFFHTNRERNSWLARMSN